MTSSSARRSRSGFAGVAYKLLRTIVTQNGPQGCWNIVSALYNRKQKTLKVHSYSDGLMMDDEAKHGKDLAHRIHITSEWLHYNVTDAKLRKLAALKNNNYIFLFGENDPVLIKFGIQNRELYNRKTFWDVQPNGKLTRAAWTYDEQTGTYRYPKQKLKTKRKFP